MVADGIKFNRSYKKAENLTIKTYYQGDYWNQDFHYHKISESCFSYSYMKTGLTTSNFTHSPPEMLELKPKKHFEKKIMSLIERTLFYDIPLNFSLNPICTCFCNFEIKIFWNYFKGMILWHAYLSFLESNFLNVMHCNEHLLNSLKFSWKT